MTIREILIESLQKFPFATNSQLKRIVEGALDKKYKHNLSGSLVKSVRDELFDFVFVYGSLLKGLSNYHLLPRIKARFVANDKIKAKLYTPHWAWPFITLNNNGKFVVGEVYRIRPTSILQIDRLEGYSENEKDVNSNLFIRHQIVTEGGRTVYVYEAGQHLRTHNAEQIKDGNWKKAYLKKHKERRLM